MPDGSGGIFTGLWWVATGKTPWEDLSEDEDGPEDANSENPSRGESESVQGQQGAWGGGRGFGK